MDRILERKSVIDLLYAVKDSWVLGIESISLYLIFMIKSSDFHKIDGELKSFVKSSMLKNRFPTAYVEFLIENR